MSRAVLLAAALSLLGCAWWIGLFWEESSFPEIQRSRFKSVTEAGRPLQRMREGLKFWCNLGKATNDLDLCLLISEVGRKVPAWLYRL